MSQARPADTGIKVGNITSSTGVAVGWNASASTYVSDSPLPVREQVIARLDEFLILLSTHADSLPDMPGIRESVVAARAAAASRPVRWDQARRLLKRIAAAVAGVSELAQAISNIQALIAHIVS